MTFKITKISKALELPQMWDQLASEYFQTREFLQHTETYNHCEQRYYLLYLDNAFKIGCIVYTLRLDLFTYLSLPSPFLMNIVGIPCSVSSSGFIGDAGLVSDLIEHLKSREKGLLLCLNLDTPPSVSNFITGRTLPTIMIANQFQTWENYLISLRAPYRRRIKILSRTFSQIIEKKGSCSRFNEEFYQQYLQVLKRSKAKLETLTLRFFQHLPNNFHLTAYYNRETLLGWYISTWYKKRYSFFLGGIEYELNDRYNTYFNLLFGVLKEGIEKKATTIDLGQTAEIPKMWLGGRVCEKLMCGTHSNWVFRTFLKVGRSMLEYSKVFPETHVFKERT